MKEIPAGIFKAECLSIMNEVQTKREPIVVTKRGKPVVKLVPADVSSGDDPIFGFFQGKGRIVGGGVGPIFDLDEWDMLK